MTCDNVCVQRAMEIYGMDYLGTDFIDAQASDNIYVQRAWEWTASEAFFSLSVDLLFELFFPFSGDCFFVKGGIYFLSKVIYCLIQGGSFVNSGRMCFELRKEL